MSCHPSPHSSTCLQLRCKVQECTTTRSPLIRNDHPRTRANRSSVMYCLIMTGRLGWLREFSAWPALDRSKHTFSTQSESLQASAIDIDYSAVMRSPVSTAAHWRPDPARMRDRRMVSARTNQTTSNELPPCPKSPTRPHLS